MEGLFSTRSRSNLRPAKRTEAQYSFLDGSARPEYYAVRGLLEDWFARYPMSGASDLRGRFRSRIDDQHRGAFFELFLHELFLSNGWSVTAGVPGAPDFSVEKGSTKFYVEATVVFPRSSLWAPRPVEDAVLDALDEIPSPDFTLWVSTTGTLMNTPPRARVVTPFERFVRSHDPDEVQATISSRGYRSAPALEVRHGGWSLRASLIPKPPHRRGGISDRTVGVGPARGGFVDSTTPLRDALVNKAKKYRGLDAPYVIAVNALDVHDPIDEMQALFGREQFTFNATDLDEEPRFSRKPDGLWYRHPSEHHASGVDGVLLFRGVQPFNVGSAKHCLYVNPYVHARLAAHKIGVSYATAEGDQMSLHEGPDLSELFGIPRGWPLAS